MELEPKRLITSALAVAAVVCAVTIVERYAPVSDIFSASSHASAAQHATSSTVSTRTKRVAAAAASIPDIIDINQADADMLGTLHGIGPAKAAAIVSYRTAHGPFYHTENIENVPGIGPSIYENIRSHITVGDVVPPPSASSNQSTSTSPIAPTHIIIAAVMTGVPGNASYQYIELYDLDAQSGDLTGWSIKKKSAAGTLSTLVAASRLKGKSIPAHGYFLIASAGYTGTVAADAIWPASYSLASAHNAIILSRPDLTTADSVSWDTIPEGHSYARTPPESATFSLAADTPHNAVH